MGRHPAGSERCQMGRPCDFSITQQTPSRQSRSHDLLGETWQVKNVFSNIKFYLYLNFGLLTGTWWKISHICASNDTSHCGGKLLYTIFDLYTAIFPLPFFYVFFVKPPFVNVFSIMVRFWFSFNTWENNCSFQIVDPMIGIIFR